MRLELGFELEEDELARAVNFLVYSEGTFPSKSCSWSFQHDLYLLQISTWWPLKTLHPHLSSINFCPHTPHPTPFISMNVTYSQPSARVRIWGGGEVISLLSLHHKDGKVLVCCPRPGVIFSSCLPPFPFFNPSSCSAYNRLRIVSCPLFYSFQPILYTADSIFFLKCQ